MLHMISFGDMEQEIHRLAKEQGYSVKEIVELVRRNEETMDLMRVSKACQSVMYCTFLKYAHLSVISLSSFTCQRKI